VFKTNKAKISILCCVLGSAAIILTLSLIVSKFQIRFKDRSAAASILADLLKSRFRGLERRKDFIVLGIPRGGVITAQIIAKKLSADFGIIIAVKIGEPDSKEKAIGAIAEGGPLYLNQKRINELQISKQYIEGEKLEQEAEIAYRISVYHGNTITTAKNFEVRGRTVVLVDDGSVTGATIIAAARSIRKEGPKSLIIGVPVAPRQIVNLLKSEADHVEVVTIPRSHNFVAVGQSYETFAPITHKEAIEIMHSGSIPV
jgi:predicted phosphoribosyltransferase